MSIFLSWSGEKSKRNAQAFSDLLLTVFDSYLNSKDIFFSPSSLKAGKDFYPQILENLNKAKIGVVFIADNNYEKHPWITFESGALKANLPEYTFVIFDGNNGSRIEFLNSKHPLNTIQMQNVTDRTSIFEILNRIKEGLSIKSLSRNDISNSFNQQSGWDDYIEKVNATILDSAIQNFRDLLVFWTTHVDNLINEVESKEDFDYPELIPEHEDISGNTIPETKTGISQFKTEYFQFNNKYKIAIRFFENPYNRGFSPIDHYIRWIPNDPKTQSAFLNIFYLPKTQRIVMKYNDSSWNEDSEQFKNHMSKYRNKKNKQFFWKKDIFMQNPTQAYNSFLEMIEYSKNAKTH